MGLMKSVSSELQYSGTFLGGYPEWEGYSLFSLRSQEDALSWVSQGEPV